jgi:hypothetical protein
MALVTTTLGAAVAVTDNVIVVASATSLTAGRLIRVDGEWMQINQAYTGGTTVGVTRGQQGSVTAAHQSGANVMTALASDLAQAPSQVNEAVLYPGQMSVSTTSYSAAGAIAFGLSQWTIAIINGTSALAMTIANPTKDQDGCYLHIVANGKAAHTVTYTAGLGNGGASFDVGTFSGSLAMSSLLVAANGFWVSVGPTTATAIGGSPTWA